MLRQSRANAFLLVLGAMTAVAACSFSFSTEPKKPAPVPPAAQIAPPRWRYAQQRYSNGQYAAPIAPPARPIVALAHAPSNVTLPAPPPPPMKVAPAAALPPGWTTVGGVPVPLIQALITPPNMQLPPGWQIPTAQALAGKHCGVANVNGKRLPLDCMTPTYGLIPWAQSTVVKRGFIEGSSGFVGATPLPTNVDNRAAGLESPIRDQGPAGTCTAVSFAAAVDHAIGRAAGRAAMVSSMHVWSHYHLAELEAAARGNRGRSLTAESSWPYEANEACSWTTQCDPGDCNKGVSCNLQPPRARVALADEAPFAEVTNVTVLDTNDVASFKSVLAKGQDIWFAMFVDDAITQVRGVNAIVPDGDFTQQASGHALVIAGYKTQANGTYYLLHNSWGTDWGDGGYAWIHENTLRRNIRSAYVVEAHAFAAPPPAPPSPEQPNPAAQTPPTPPPPPAPAPPGGRAACNSGLPDSTTGECVPQCPDGSPRANGVCAAAGQCAPGQINLFGICILGAPTKPPTVDPVSGVKVMCAPGGCTYFMAFGQQGCQQLVCTQSCAAPKFVLTSGPNGLACSE